MTKKLSAFLAVSLLGGAAAYNLYLPTAAAQSSTTGALRGLIRDKATKEAVVGATIVATSTALAGEQVVVTDESGQYFLDALPPGTYILTVYYGDAKFSRGNVLVQVGKQAVVNIPVDTAAAAGEVVEVEGSAPIVDQGSTKTGRTITSDLTNNLPVGRTFGAVLGSTPGSQGDQYGVSFGGATSVENTYIVEGLNTTDTAFGQQSSNLPTEFIGETEVITGGYQAEFGRATGGVINVVTKQGSDEFHGSVFAYFRPGALVASADSIEREGSAIDTETNLNYDADVGAEIGGPIIKKKLWFHVGFNPSFSKRTTDRIISRVFDRDGDGIADIDSATGFSETEEVSRSDIPRTQRTTFFTAKVNGNLGQNHQYQVSAFGNPTSNTELLTVTRNPLDTRFKQADGAYDFAGKWTSKFMDGDLQLDAVVGFHRGFERQKPFDSSRDVPTVFYRNGRSLVDFADIEPGLTATTKCDIINPGQQDEFDPCPVLNYVESGQGFFEKRTNDRRTAVLSATYRVNALGYHTFKVGGDVELSTYNSNRRYTGDIIFRRSASGVWQRREFLRNVRQLTQEERDLAGMGMLDLPEGQYACANDLALCEIAAGGLDADTNNRGFGAYAQDSWQILPNLSINAGVRWEQLTGFAAKAVQGKISPEGEVIPDVAYKLNNMIAPRVGVIYDPTQEGKSKLFGHWGRFYENIPMDINVRAFGGEILNLSLLNTAGSDAARCEKDHGDEDIAGNLRSCTDIVPQAILGGGTEFVSPGMKGQYSEDWVLGGEYQLLPDFKMGVTYVRKSLPQVIEDVSTDGGNNYMITNPGRDFTDEATELRAQADALPMEDADLAALYNSRADQLDYVGRFDKPSRNYDAIEVTATQRPTRNSLLLASYTYSKSRGNFPGLFSTETGQLDPNLTSMYDLPDLMANRFGALGLDRPHNVKIDGVYTFDFDALGYIRLGSSFRAQSGIAHNALAGHPTYGTDESYLLGRGSFNRSPTTWQLDVKAQYGRALSKTVRLELFFDVFNLFNSQDEVDADETYTFDNAVPIVGGDEADLEHIKLTDENGYQMNETPTRNPNFGNLNARQAPLSGRFGLRLTF